MESKIEVNEEKTVNIIATGCIHNSMDKMYKEIQEYEKQNKKKIDLVICTGDFESIRNEEDLTFLSCPKQYRVMGDFHKYYSSKIKAPYLTIFIGGNHEASNYLEQMYYGGYAAENIYYLGRGGIINVKGLRIGGISGIFNKNDYFRGHFEKNENDIKGDKKSIFHYREFEIVKMSHIKKKLDIFMTHDWPTNIIHKKDFSRIFKLYPQNEEAISSGTLGSFPGEFILKLLKPNYYICGHMHFYYTNMINDTKIYALDKCVNKRHYFDFIEVKPSLKDINIDDNNIYIDPEWMAITNAFNDYFPNENKNYSLLDIFSENSKLLYNNIVLDKIRIDRNNIVDIIDENDLENKINDLILKKFNKREKVIYELNQQTELLLAIFNIAKDENKHYLSSIYLNNKSNTIKK